MSEERPKVKDHWMILRCGVKIWNRWREANPGTRPDLGGANLERADLGNASLRYANLRYANLRDANLRDANLWDANLGNANLESADLGDANLRDAYLGGAKLGGANLRCAKLLGSNLRYVDLRGANLEGANLRDASFRLASLWGANLRVANLRNAIFRDAILQNANLENANLENANLGNAILKGANLSDARFLSTIFSDLREVKGLQQANHQGPSPVSSQTLGMSQGQIPEVFLKGCGLKDWEILSAKLHDPNLRPDQIADITYQVYSIRASSPIVPLSVFISYTRDDERFVEKAERQFDKDGIRFWRDVHDMVAGPVEAQVDRAIGLQRVTLLVLSEKSVNSRWVEAEAEKALDAEKELNKDPKTERRYLLCPVALDNTWEKCGWPGWLRGQIKKVNILDFSRWGSDDEFKTQYEKLKRGLGIYYADKGES